MPSTRSTVILVAISVALLVGGLVAASGNLSPAGDEASPAASTADPTTSTPAPDTATPTPDVELAAGTVPGWIRTDEAAMVNVTLANSGGAAASLSPALRVDSDGDGTFDATLDRASSRIPAGDSRTISFAVSGTDLAPGRHQVAVVHGDATLEVGELEVLAPPRLEFATVDAATTAVQGEPAPVSATVENIGELYGSGPVELSVATSANESLDLGLRDRIVSLEAGQSHVVSRDVPTGDLAPGTYTYTLETPDATSTGTLTVLQPATIRITDLDGPGNVTRGEAYNVSVTVTNAGDVRGAGNVTLDLPGDRTVRQSLTLEAGANRTLRFTGDTGALDRGTYDLAAHGPDNGTGAAVRVREPAFAVADLRGNETLLLGDRLVFAANVTNTGDATGNATVEFRLDVDGDDVPDAHGITREVRLAPGNATVVRFDVPYDEDPDPLDQVEDLPTGTYIYGIYADGDNETGVFDVRQAAVSWDRVVGGSGDGGSDEEGPGPSTQDEIAQAKYGLYYDQLSGETQGQVQELYVRQPFAGGLGITDVLTREEIARQKYGLDVDVGDRFDFTAIDVETQQAIEADFDAQFTTESGDRIESWDELARIHYDAGFESLNESRQTRVKELYRDQFE